MQMQWYWYFVHIIFCFLYEENIFSCEWLVFWVRSGENSVLKKEKFWITSLRVIPSFSFWNTLFSPWVSQKNSHEQVKIVFFHETTENYVNRLLFSIFPWRISMCKPHCTLKGVSYLEIHFILRANFLRTFRYRNSSNKAFHSITLNFHLWYKSINNYDESKL